MATESKRQGDYVGLSTLFHLVQIGRKELGLPPYKRSCSLSFALLQNRIPTKKITPHRKLYHAPTALRVLCPGTSIAGSQAPQSSEQWVTLREVYCKANQLRISLGLPPLKSANSAGGTLRRKNVPRRRYGPRNYYWQLESALRSLTRHDNSHPQLPRHRTATEQEIASGQFMPLTECARMLRCSSVRLASAAAKYYILALRHPITNVIWVRVKDAELTAYYRRASFLHRHPPEERVHYLMANRHYITHSWNGSISRLYYVPELAHLSARTTKATTPTSKP